MQVSAEIKGKPIKPFSLVEEAKKKEISMIIVDAVVQDMAKTTSMINKQQPMAKTSALKKWA